jgi:hypothetical protein
MLKNWFITLILVGFTCALAPAALAQNEDISEDDAYDPFADYSEFEASADEEADIHFFKNGRFFNLAFMIGGRGFTEELGNLNKGGVAYGMAFTYFFDLRTAIQVSYVHSEHDFSVPSGTNSLGQNYNAFSGNTALSSIAAHMKYYFNTANVTRGFADLNPYAIGGFAVNYRNITIQGEDVVVKSSPTSMDIGAGIEIPIARKKMYVGFEAMYHYVRFPDEGYTLHDDIQTDTEIKPRGDFYSAMFLLGINF